MNPPTPDRAPATAAPPGAAAPSEPAPARASAPPATGRRIPYQPALDGLRAFAILTIMLYHGQVTWPRGGYLSVDLFLMLAGIAAYAALLAPAARLARMRWDALATLAYVANWRFAFTHLSYFEQFGDSSPLTHMWTLGIEEQYYLLWPLVLIVGLRLARGCLRLVLVGTLLVLCASALTMAALYCPGVDLSRLYYGIDTRAQALLFGGALAVVLAMWDYRPRPRALVQVAAVVGFGGCLAMLLLIPDTVRWMYLGGFTMAAAACGLTVVVAAQPGGWVRRIFSTPPLPAIGRISYGLYLWHWPLFVAISPERV